MYTLTISHDEKQALLEILECSLSELHSEIVHTENHCFKKTLKERKQVLVTLRNSLQQVQFPAS